METSKNGEIYLIADEQLLYLTLQDIDNQYSNSERIPKEDSLIADYLYGENEHKKDWYFQKICTYKKYLRICEYSITQGKDVEIDMVKLLKEEMKLACCNESDIDETVSYLKKLYLDTKSEDFVRRARDMVDLKIADSKKNIFQSKKNN
ncbi:MAG: hypothetical protein K6D97_05010 [Clostridia bacterium]|nr:hypothetical protein [Clostridia bacterium]